MRGATVRLYYSPTIACNFNSRTPCGVRLRKYMDGHLHQILQSTHPMRGATQYPKDRPLSLCTSIHAPHAGCDRVRSFTSTQSYYFNPRAPCGVRPAASTCMIAKFSALQSTHPMWGATLSSAIENTVFDTSIHAPHVGCDCKFDIL